MPETKVPAIKNIPAKLDSETKLVLESIKEALEVRLGRRGDELDRAITLRELIDSGLATQLAQSPYNPNTGATGFGPIGERPGDVTVPPAPTVLTASGLFTDALLSWNQSTNTAPYGNHGFTEIWRSQAEDLSSAVMVGTTNAFIYTDKGLEYDFTYYYWVRFVSTSSIPGPWSNMASATTIENIAATMAALSETLAGLPGYSLLSTGAVAATVIKQSSAPSTRADGSALSTYDFWLDTDDNQMYIRNAANSAWVAGRDSTLVSLYGATSYTGSTITSAMASAQADIITVTSAQSSTAASLSSLSTTVTNNNNTLTSAINTEASSRTTGDQTNATAITNLTSTVVGNNNTLTASVNTLGTTTANINGDLDAMYVINVATESNGSKSAAGMVIGSNANSGSGATSYVQFRADTFAIWNPSTTSTVAPFIITDNVVYIDTARIKDAAIVSAKIDTLHGNKIIANTITATQIAANTITATQILADTITATQIAANTITAAEILANTITADEINVDTLNVKHFDNVSTDIKSHLSAGTFFPLGRSAQNFVERASAYTGSTGSFVPVTITEIRNGATYIAIFSGVLGNVSGGVVQYSLDNSTWVNASGNTNIYWNAGTYRGYTYVYTGQITGLSTSQSTVYWRVYFSGGYNHTQLSLNIIMDNTQ
jgi:hypothetical protein